MISIRALRRQDDRARFESGDEDLDRFLRKYAGQNQFAHHIGTTYVAVEEERIVGFATVAPGALLRDGIPEAEARRLPRYPLPVLRFARLAVDRSQHGRGIAAALVRHVFFLAIEMSRDLGCLGVVVDARPRAIEFYRKLGFAPLGPLEGQLVGVPEPAPMFFHVDTIRLAAE